MKEKLIASRKAAGLEQVDIAEALGVDKSTISRFERLDSNPSLSMIRNYAHAVGCLVKHDVVHFPETATADVVLWRALEHLMRSAIAHRIDPTRSLADFEVVEFLMEGIESCPTAGSQSLQPIRAHRRTSSGGIGTVTAMTVVSGSAA